MSIFSSKGAVEGWLHYSPQDQTNFSSKGLRDLHLFAVMRKYNVVLGFFPVSPFFKSVLYMDHVGACLNCQFIVQFALY